MRKLAAPELLYDPIPKPDVKLPPMSEPKSLREDAKKLIDQDRGVEQRDYLANLSFS